MVRFKHGRDLNLAFCIGVMTAGLVLTSVSSAQAKDIASPTLTSEDLQRLSSPARNFRPRDPFSESPKINLKGRRFIVDLPVRKGGSGACSSLPFWHYNVENRKLELFFLGSRHSGFSLKSYSGVPIPLLYGAAFVQTAPVACVEVPRGSYQASNAFGMTTTIFKTLSIVTEIAVMRPIGATFETHFLRASVTIDPAEARAVTSVLRLRVEGELAEWENGSSVACGFDRNNPNMISAYDTTTDTCIFIGKIDRVAFIDPRTETVLAQKITPIDQIPRPVISKAPEFEPHRGATANEQKR